MEHALLELPLAIFSTLAPIGAGLYVVLALVLNSTKFDEENLGTIDKFSTIAFILVLLGLVASVFHLGNPLAGVNIMAGLGESPLSNEIAVAACFTVVAGIYTLLGLMKKLTKVSRMILLALCAVLSIVFSIFIGLAYYVDTIPTWYNMYASLEIVGFSLVGGSAIAVLVLGMSKCLTTLSQAGKMIIAGIAIVGALLACFALFAHVSEASLVKNALVPVSHAVEEANFAILCAYIGLCASALISVLVAFKPTLATLAVLSLIFAIAGTFAGRLFFYAIQTSVGLQFKYKSHLVIRVAFQG